MGKAGSAIAELRAERDRLLKENERLKQPVSDEEWQSATRFYDGTDHDYDTWAIERDALNDLLATRAEGGGVK